MLRVLSIIFYILLLSVICACSSTENTGNNNNGATPTPVQKQDKMPEASPLKPATGELSITIPKGWSINKSGSTKDKDAEVYTFIRWIDRRLWSNPGAAGTTYLPVMSMTVTKRDAKASRADLDPQTLGKALVKQEVYTNLVEAKEQTIAKMKATVVVGDTTERGRTTIIMLPNNGFLYKWTLDGTKPTDLDVYEDFKLMLESVSLNK